MSLDVIATSPQAAHDACSEAWRVCKELTLAGKPVQITAGEAEDQRSIEQNRYYWGPLLGAVSEQARTPDRWTQEAWHHLFRRMFLGYEIKKELVAGKKRPTIIRRLRSTRDLKVKPFAVYLQKIEAYVSTELGVQLPESK
jgi:hypothetical protein